ncbi:MAG: GNAT family N-acetyltransferase [Acholeplasma sp.]|nr:GNAT family N-acetyltransferase [Acholeplasma sp.]
MNIKIDELSKVISKYQKEFNYFGNISVFYKGEEIISQSNGYLNINNKTKYQKDSAFNIEKTNDFFVTIILLKLLRNKKIPVTELINKYLPELKHSDKIRFIDVLRDETGLPDYRGYYREMLNKNCDIESEDETFIKNINISYQVFKYHEVLSFYNNKDLSHEPGSEYDESMINQIIGVELIERINKTPYEEVLDEMIFKPLNINKTNVEKSLRYFNRYFNRMVEYETSNNQDFIGLDMKTFYQIYRAMKTGVLLDKRDFRLMTKIKNYNGIGYSERFSFAKTFVRKQFIVYDYKDMDLEVIFGSTFFGHEVLKNEELVTIDYYLLQQITPYFLSYKDPKLVRLNKKNVYDLLYIENELQQLWYMGPPRYVLAYAFSDKNVHCYLLMDQNIVVGTISLYIDRKNKSYWISNVLIDRRYQRRGYGKKLIIEALEILKKHQLNSISLYVERNNEAAYKTYLKAGFIVKEQYPNSYLMVKDLVDNEIR